MVLDLFIAVVASASQSGHDAQLGLEKQAGYDEPSRILIGIRDLCREVRASERNST